MLRLDYTKLLNSIPLSESDKRLIEMGHDLRVDYLNILEKSLPENNFILEVSTGTGRMLSLLVRLGYKVISGDLDRELKENSIKRVSKEYLPLVNYLILDLGRLPVKSNAQKDIISVNTIHELDEPENSFQELIRIHHREGKLVIADFNSLGFEVMDLAHRAVHGVPHREGIMKMSKVSKLLKNYYENVDIFDTQLNTVCIATNKR